MRMSIGDKQEPTTSVSGSAHDIVTVCERHT